MQTHRFKTFILFILCVSFYRVALASSVVRTEFELMLPRSFQQNLIEQVWESLQKQEFRFSWALPDQTFDTPDVKVLINGIKLDVRTRLQKPAIGGRGDTVLLESRGLEASLYLQSVSIDQWITREVGGVIGRFRIQANCEGVQLRLQPGKASLSMRLSPVFDGAFVRARVEDANLSWTPDAWQITSLNCTGTQGFDDVIREEIGKRTGDASIVTSQKETLMQYVRDYVNSHSVDLSQPRDLVPVRPDILLSFRISNFTTSEKNLIVRGTLRVEFTRNRGGDSSTLRLSKASLGSSSSIVVRVPEGFVLAVAKQAYAGNTWSKKVYSDEVPGFQALMNSRLLQFFVWHELLSFPKSAKFLFEVYSPEDISITGKNLTYAVKATLFAKMYAPKKRQYVPFMNFTVPMRSQVKLSLENGIIAAKFTDIHLGLRPQWEPSYVAEYSPSQTFAAEKIRQRIQDSVQGGTLRYKLPSIPIFDETSLTVQKVQPNKSGDLVLYLGAGSAPVPHGFLPTAAE